MPGSPGWRVRWLTATWCAGSLRIPGRICAVASSVHYVVVMALAWTAAAFSAGIAAARGLAAWSPTRASLTTTSPTSSCAPHPGWLRPRALLPSLAPLLLALVTRKPRQHPAIPRTASMGSWTAETVIALPAALVWRRLTTRSLSGRWCRVRMMLGKPLWPSPFPKVPSPGQGWALRMGCNAGGAVSECTDVVTPPSPSPPHLRVGGCRDRDELALAPKLPLGAVTGGCSDALQIQATGGAPPSETQESPTSATSPQCGTPPGDPDATGELDGAMDRTCVAEVAGVRGPSQVRGHAGPHGLSDVPASGEHELDGFWGGECNGALSEAVCAQDCQCAECGWALEVYSAFMGCDLCGLRGMARDSGIAGKGSKRQVLRRLMEAGAYIEPVDETSADV